MNTVVYNLKGETVSTIELSDKIFSRPWNPDLVKQVYDAQVANRRKPYAHAKGRGEVSGGGRKPWRQKGTGRARHGSIRSPLWKGGGVSHGPLKEKIYAKKINAKMKRAALHSLLSKKLEEKELRIIDSLAVSSHKTKELNVRLKEFFSAPKSSAHEAIILVPQRGNTNLVRAASNIPKVKNLSPASLNVGDLLTHRYVLIDARAALEIQ